LQKEELGLKTQHLSKLDQLEGVTLSLLTKSEMLATKRQRELELAIEVLTSSSKY
jgi:hypothetical protein